MHLACELRGAAATSCVAGQQTRGRSTNRRAFLQTLLRMAAVSAPAVITVVESMSLDEHDLAASVAVASLGGIASLGQHGTGARAEEAARLALHAVTQTDLPLPATPQVGEVKVKVKVGKSLHKLNFPVLTSSFRPLFDLPDAPSAVPPTSSEWVPGRPVPKPWRFY